MVKPTATFSRVTQIQLGIGCAVVAREYFVVGQPLVRQREEFGDDQGKEMYAVSDRGWAGNCVAGSTCDCCVFLRWTLDTTGVGR